MSTQRKLVLVVDDDPDLRTMLDILLSSEGYEVVLAGDGQEALNLIARRMPQLILLDMRMPGMDGWAFAKIFHEKFGHRVPIVVLTAAENAKARGLEADAEDYLEKPFNIDEVLEKVSRLAA